MKRNLSIIAVAAMLILSLPVIAFAADRVQASVGVFTPVGEDGKDWSDEPIYSLSIGETFFKYFEIQVGISKSSSHNDKLSADIDNSNLYGLFIIKGQNPRLQPLLGWSPAWSSSTYSSAAGENELSYFNEVFIIGVRTQVVEYGFLGMSFIYTAVRAEDTNDNSIVFYGNVVNMDFGLAF